MNIQNIHLDIQCSNPACKGFNYFEDETGYYICADCNTISQIRCGLELDYTAPIRSIRSKVIKSEEDDNNISDDGILNENNDFDLISQKLSLEGGDTIMNISTTNVKSSRLETSSFNDYSSICSKSIKKKFIQIKTPQEILIEIQRYFENIINVLINDFFEKKEDNINNNYLKNIYFNKIINFGENEKKIFYGITRRIWIYFVTKKYKVIENPIYKKKKLIRSRINSIDEEKEIKKNKDNENEHIKGKINKKKKVKNQKVKRLHEQLKMRRITERNIYNIYNSNNLLSNYSFGRNYKLKNNNKNNFYNENNFNIESQKKNIFKKIYRGI